MREAQGELGRQSHCMDKLRATGAGAYIRAVRYEGWRIYTRFARTTGRGRGDKELGRQSRCKDKLRATMAGAYIRASRAPQDLSST